MPSGYEKSPDYGGKPPDRATAIMFAAFVLAVFGLPLLFGWLTREPQAACREIKSSEVESFERDGKTYSTLDLSKVAKDECFTIRP
jgi:hypothetical protein